MEKLMNYMEKVEESQKQVGTKSLCESSQHGQTVKSSRAMKLMTALRAIYGTKFSKSYPTTHELMLAASLWERQLSEFTNEILERATNECINKFEWPPGIAEFKSLCKSLRGDSKVPWAEDVLKFEKPKRDKRTQSDVQRIIEEGAWFCKKLKILYPEKSWMEIAKVSCKAKNSAKKFYPEFSEINILIELNKYKNLDLLELISEEVA